MLDRIKLCIPNTITCLNLVSGCVAIYMAFNMSTLFGPLTGGQWALVAMGMAAVFDFFDGMSARLLKGYSDLGKELDSLSDLVSFGVAPAMLVLNIMLGYGSVQWGGFAALLGSTMIPSRLPFSADFRFRRMPSSGSECTAGPPPMVIPDGPSCLC